MAPQPSGVITTDPDRVQIPDMPILRVADVNTAIIAMGHYAREQMTGNVLAVTGSAGKTTTVAMLSHALSAWGPVGQSSHNANLPHGVAWNLASIPWDTPSVVLELAIGRMAQSARMARPQVAIFTNILPAHLGDHHTIVDVALRKSAIFLGMSQGGVAVLNRDMLEWETVYKAARARALEIVHYGTTRECEFRLVHYSPAEQRVTAQFMNREVHYRIGAAGPHMAMNSLAVVAAVSALGYQVEPAIAQLENFAAVPGRGEEFEVMLDERRLILIDDAYNANPGSMRAALIGLGEKTNAHRRIAVLGEMAELGPQAEKYHADLADLIELHGIDRV
jgi:UDP-N-acetylmuramyl pentapeptide synthase